MLRLFFVTTIICSTFWTQSFAQNTPPILPAPATESGMEANPPGEPIETDTSPLKFKQKAAPGSCANDAQRFCAGKKVGQGWLKCLGEHEAKLSSGCLREMDLISKNWRQTYPNWVMVRAECQTVTDSFCKDAAKTKSKQKMLACFKKNESKLPKDCLYWVNEYVKRRAVWK